LTWRATLISYIQERLTALGDVLEVGVGRGELTAYLAYAASLQDKKVFAVDVCNIDFDQSKNEGGLYLPDYYRQMGLTLENQEEVIRLNIKDCSNVVFFKMDSAKLTFPENQQFCLAVIDGCHTSEYIRSDFLLAWPRISEGGFVAMHDYGGDMPNVTAAIQLLLKEFEAEIASTAILYGWWIVIEKKEKSVRGDLID
jgi:SAM-dependent methyltransferase